jgi:hypothetical protein
MTTAHSSTANYKQVLARYARLPKDIKSWLDIVPELIERYKWEVSIAFVFMQIESMFHDTLYRGLVKLHRTDSGLTRELLDRDHFTRGRLKELFKTVFGVAIPSDVDDHLKAAETIRNRTIHGKKVTDAQARACLMAAFEFFEGFNNAVEDAAKFRPCGDGRGFKGRAESLGKETSRWVLRGMGIPGRKGAEVPD